MGVDGREENEPRYVRRPPGARHKRRKRLARPGESRWAQVYGTGLTDPKRGKRVMFLALVRDVRYLDAAWQRLGFRSRGDLLRAIVRAWIEDDKVEPHE